MAIVFTPSKRGTDTIGRRQFHPGKMALDADYPTGGYAVTLATIKAKNARAIESCIITGGNAAANTRKFQWDSVNNKIMAAQTGLASTPFVEPVNLEDLSAVVLDCIFILV